MISMDELSQLPMDIFLEILDWLQLRSYERLHMLQQLRLTSRAFSKLATPVLFRDFRNFQLGDCYEDVELRIKTLSKAPDNLRRRITGLRIPINVFIPRGISKKALTEDEYEKSLIGIMFRDVHKQMKRLLETFPPNYRFETIVIGGFSNSVFESVYRLYDSLFPIARLHLFNLASKCMTDPRFSRLTTFDATFYRPDMWNLLRNFIDNPSLENRAKRELEPLNWKKNQLPESLLHLTSLKFRFPFTSGPAGPTEGESLAIGDLVRRARAPNLHLIYDRRYSSEFLPLIHWMQGDTHLPHLTSLRIDTCCITAIQVFVKTIMKVPNLQSLELRGVEIVGTWQKFFGSKSWDLIFDEICENLPHLIHVNFQNLGYFQCLNTHDFDEDEEGDRMQYPRPIFTNRLADIVALQALLRTVEARRAIKGLPEHRWISVFCRKRGVLQIYEGTNRTKGTSPTGSGLILNARDWVKWRNVNIDGELEPPRY